MFPGKQVSVRLNRSQIDKASKDKSGKFSENFNVTFFYDVASEHVITNIFNKANSFQHFNQFPAPVTTCEDVDDGPPLSVATGTTLRQNNKSVRFLGPELLVQHL